MEYKLTDPLLKHNEIVTYHSFLTPQSVIKKNLFLNPRFRFILSNIERTANCIIRTRSLISSDLQCAVSNIKSSGYWLTEIYYHQLHGKHDVAMKLIDCSIKTFNLHRTPLRTTRGFFKIEDEKILSQMGYINQSWENKSKAGSFSKVKEHREYIPKTEELKNVFGSSSSKIDSQGADIVPKFNKKEVSNMTELNTALSDFDTGDGMKNSFIKDVEELFEKSEDSGRENTVGMCSMKNRRVH